MKKIIAYLVKKHRILKNMTQQALADTMEVERQYIWKIEHEKVNIRLDYLDRIIRALGCSHAEFFGGLTDDFSQQKEA